MLLEEEEVVAVNVSVPTVTVAVTFPFFDELTFVDTPLMVTFVMVPGKADVSRVTVWIAAFPLPNVNSFVPRE